MNRSSGKPWVMGALALALIAVTTSFHYLTDMHDVAFHNVYRRLYYVPILLAAFGYGLRGGLAAAVLASAAYMPHAFFMHHRDPAPTVDKVLEIVLYLAIGALTGWLVERETRARRALETSLAARDELEKQLVRAGKLSALGSLTAGLAHEIRNPLASILGSAEALAEEFEPEHRKFRMAELLLQEINRLNRVVSEFLDFARPSVLEMTDVSLDRVARDVCDLTASSARDAGVLVESTVQGCTVKADAEQIQQVVLNLVLNAYEAVRDADKPAVSLISTRKRVAGVDYICLGVRDNGPGIPDDAVDVIFDPYFSTREGGVGLGLSISSTIMERHQGFIDVESRPGQTTMWLCFSQEST